MSLDRLNGWKEIAAYLGKSVRTVQRWERDYGVPIRRVGRDGGEIVWASRTELDAWQVEFDRLRSSEFVSNADRTPAAIPPARSFRVSPLVLIAATAAVVTLAMFLAAPIRTTETPAQPARATVEPEFFHVFDANGQPLFSKHVAFLRKEDFEGPATGKPGSWAQFTDLDGDGTLEVIFLALSIDFSPETAVIVFNADGSERFRVRPQNRVTFGKQVFTGPWRPHRALAAPNGRSGQSLFVAFIGPLEFPTLVVEVDATGRILADYWSNGYVQTIRMISWRGQRTLFLGATHNDSRGASLAVFPNGKLSGSAPASQDEYRCHDCGHGGPAEFLLFPRRRLALTIRGQATAQDIRILENDTLHVNVGEGSPDKDGWFEHNVWYTLDPHLTVANALFPSGVVAVHNKLFANGTLETAFGAVDERAVFPVRRWSNGQFVEIPSGTISH